MLLLYIPCWTNFLAEIMVYGQSCDLLNLEAMTFLPMFTMVMNLDCKWSTTKRQAKTSVKTRKDSIRKEWIVMSKKMWKEAVMKKMTNHEEETTKC